MTPVFFGGLGKPARRLSEVCTCIRLQRCRPRSLMHGRAACSEAQKLVRAESAAIQRFHAPGFDCSSL